MKLTIEITHDRVYDAVLAAWPSIKANSQLCQLYPQMVREIGPIRVAMKPTWEANMDEPEAYGEMVISHT